jgi:dihydropteroate synthase
MGIVNVTPDSFSDGGRYHRTDLAVAHALELVREGADLLDIGGESTRPGSQPVSLEEEMARVVPVVTALARQTTVPLSVDTSKAEVARACLQAGAHVINDVTGLTGDPGMVDTAREFAAGVIVMHMQGTPATMHLAPHYQDVVSDIAQYLAGRIEALAARGIPPEAIAVDPGMGFGKNREHTLTLMGQLARFAALGRPVCLGVSRKGFIGEIIQRPRDQRVFGSLAAAAYALAQNAVHILRVHDVAPTRDLVLMWEALRAQAPPS